MRQIILFIMGLLFLTGCATSKNKIYRSDNVKNFGQEKYDVQKEKLRSELNAEYLNPSPKKNRRPQTTYNPYAGVTGFLNRPPSFIDIRSAQQFERCDPVEIVGVRDYQNKIFVIIKQNNRTFSMTGMNRQSFAKNKLGRIPLLDFHLAKSIDWTNRSRGLASVNQRVCGGQTWPEMSQAQFRFVYGDPEYRKFINTNQGQYDVWTYVGADRNKPRHYYFLSYRLYSWTP